MLERVYGSYHNQIVAMQEKSSVFYEAAPPQASRELAELRMSPDYTPPFQIIRRRVIDDYNEGRMTIDATVVIRIGDLEETEAARGVGVVHALDLALRKALLKYFPYVASVRVTETYTHGSGESTEAEVISVKKFSDGHSTWTTMAKSANTVEAGWSSLVDGYEWRINLESFRARRSLGNPRLSSR
ncbi:MAG TPA: alpha-isopropylmalate synthase regulatory domain-containing protein [Candidatus Binataceae bacterium]|nr:alpha-isopropylmalate synthase regulatory domain-containing protein [Candidatus Binataceae bacterium]